MARSEPDDPKSLHDPELRAQRLGLIEKPHVMALTALVRRMRHERRLGEEIPYFDPLDGGVNAHCLFLFEAPGRKAVESGFVSRNNNDETAKNFLLLNREAGIPRELTVSWNIIPWYIDRDSSNKTTEIEAGREYPHQLLRLLPQLELAVLMGRSAQKAEPWIEQWMPELKLFFGYHPSPMFVNRRPQNRGLILAALKQVAAELGLEPEVEEEQAS